MKIQNMTSANGNKIANQFIITCEENHPVNGEESMRPVDIFQSYDSVIAKITYYPSGIDKVELDEKYWDYSVTTSKYRNLFLGETKKETQAKIDSGEYKLANLN